MVKKWQILGIGLLGFAVISGLVGWWGSQPHSRSDERSSQAQLTVGATIFPLADLVRQVGGERVEVVLLIPPGVSEHSSALTPQQLAAVQSAATIFSIGHGLDDRLVEPLARANRIPVTVVDDGIALREFGVPAHEGAEEEHGEEEVSHDHAGIDPHYWLTVPNVQRISDTIAQTLMALDPDGSAVYQENVEQLQARLSALEEDLQRQAATAQQREFVAMHDAWGYLAEHYGFELVGTYESVEGRQPSAVELQELQELIREHDIQTFYAEPQKRSTAAVAFLERELALVIKVLDPVGGIEGRDSYEAMMRFNIAALAGMDS